MPSERYTEGPPAFRAVSVVPFDSTRTWAFPWILSSGVPAFFRSEQAVAMHAFRKVHRRSTGVQSGIGRPVRFHQDLGFSLDSVQRSPGFLGVFGWWLAGATAQCGKRKYEKTEDACVAVHPSCPRFRDVFVRIRRYHGA